MKLDEILNSPFTFTKRKNFTPCDTRPLWKSLLVILIIGVTGKNNSASLKKIHVANWIVKDSTHLTAFTQWEGKDDRKRPDVRLEPAIDRVINLLVSNSMIEKNNGKIALTEIGVNLLNELNSVDVYMEEKNSLSKAKKFLSEAAVNRIFEGV